MNNQEIIDRVRKHFITDGNPASIGEHYGPYGTSCKYRGKNGAKCAVGLFIKDDEYEHDMERLTVHGIIDRCADLSQWNLGVLGKLQAAHDNWATSLCGIGRFSLDIDSIEKEYCS